MSNESMKVTLGMDPDAKQKAHDVKPTPKVDKGEDVAGAYPSAPESEENPVSEEVDVDAGQSSEADSEGSEESDVGIDLESLDPELEVWPEGPKVGQVLEWKSMFGEVYTTSLTMDYHVMWRPITRNEYKMHVKQMEQLANQVESSVELNMLQEEILTEMCTLFPKFSRAEMANELAGMPSIIAQQVMEASGFSALEVRQL